MKTYIQILSSFLGWSCAVGPMLSLQAQENSLPQPMMQCNFESSSQLSAVGSSLEGSASLTTIKDVPVVDLGNDNGYVNLGNAWGEAVRNLNGDFSFSALLYVPASCPLWSNGNFIYTFANSANLLKDARGCLFFSAKETRYAICSTNYTTEKEVRQGSTFPTDVWTQVTYVEQGKQGTIYLDGQAVATGPIDQKPASLGSTTFNFLGRSCYAGDVYLRGAQFADFRLYDVALQASEVRELNAEPLAVLNAERYADEVQQAYNALTLNVDGGVLDDLDLPTMSDNGVSIVWTSSNEAVISTQGKVTPQTSGNVHVVLTAVLSKGHSTKTKSFVVKVLQRLSDEDYVALDLSNLSLDGDLWNLYEDLELPTQSKHGCVIEWTTSDASYLTAQGQLLQLAPQGEGKLVTLTARLTLGEAQGTRDFEVNIGQDEGMSAYLFAYFTGNRPEQEQICFALSEDGYNYTPLNEGNPVIASADIAKTGCVRDPHILRGEDGKTFYMVATDMKSSLGWSSNDGLVLMKSTDLLHWSSVYIDFPDTWPQLFDRDDLTQVWAPQTCWDPEAQRYMVYYSIGKRSQAHYMIFYSYANEDFTELTEPALLFDLGSNTIDSDIVYYKGQYHLFFKTEGNGNGIQKATAPKLSGPWTPLRTYYQQTNVAVEGSGVFKLINSNNWVLMYDCYGSGYYQFCSSTDLEHFTWVKNTTTSGAFTPRHGTVMAITADEVRRLKTRWDPAGLETVEIGAHGNSSAAIFDVCGRRVKTMDRPGLYVVNGKRVYKK